MSDFVVTTHGTVWIFHARSPEAKALLPQLDIQPYQFWGGSEHSFTVDHRPAHALVERLYEDGFSVEQP